MPAERIWLDVPYAEKDLAKAEGARWDPGARRWYAPRPGIAGLERWLARPDVPDLLPGEDRSLGSGLFVDLVPTTCWFTNVRSCVSQQDWERLRRMVVNRAGRVCEICGASADREAQRWLEVHERWIFEAVQDSDAAPPDLCLHALPHRHPFRPRTGEGDRRPGDGAPDRGDRCFCRGGPASCPGGVRALGTPLAGGVGTGSEHADRGGDHRPASARRTAPCRGGPGPTPAPRATVVTPVGAG